MKFVIPWKNVISIEKKGMVLGIVPNALKITTLMQREVRMRIVVPNTGIK
jgi:hypothetical protein